MKRIKPIKKTSFDEDMIKALRIYSRNNFGFQKETVVESKKKYNRNNYKRELRKECSL